MILEAKRPAIKAEGPRGTGMGQGTALGLAGQEAPSIL